MKDPSIRVYDLDTYTILPGFAERLDRNDYGRALKDGLSFELHAGEDKLREGEDDGERGNAEVDELEGQALR